MHILQIILPFFIAGIGTCFAGLILDRVQFKTVFTQVDELFILLPALLGLKGNLQMTLASRFSTHSHLGHLQTKEDLLKLTCANLSLNQCLSIVISLCASLLATIIHLIASAKPFEGRHLLLTTTTALLTSSVTSFLLDILMIMVVQVSSLFSINPDNVATPIAASLGDTTALVLCYYIADFLYRSWDISSFYWITSVTILFYIFLIPTWATVTQENVHTSKILLEISHWYPLLTAMIISSLSGVILKTAITRSLSIALFQPVICGVGGNLVAVQLSRLSSLLHQNVELGTLPAGETACMSPFHLFTSSSPGFSITRILMIIVMPGQLLFYLFCVYLNSQGFSKGFSVTFLSLYLLASQIQVVTLLYLAYVLTYILWLYKIDPDNCTIPYLTSVSDVLGACLITAICLIALPEPANPNKQNIPGNATVI